MYKFLLCWFFSVSIFADQTLLVDPYFSPYTGANDLFFVEWGLTKLEDYLYPKNKSDDTFSIIGRGVEQVAWATLNQVTSTTQHEVFGHGYRLRELGVTPEKYEITLSGGATYFNVSDSFLIGNMQAVVIAGLEAEAILAETIKMNWMQKGSIDGRLAMTYFQAQQSVFFYTLITHLGRLKDNTRTPGNDVDAYEDFLNAIYPSSHITIGNLTVWSAFNWLDPMTFYSLFSWFYYIAEGKPWDFPSFHLGEKIRYLPNVKIGYAPYGPEAYLENFFSIDNHPLYFYVKGGQRSLGTGLYYDHIIEKNRITLGLHTDGWVQSPYISSGTLGDFEEGKSVAAPSGKVWGISASVISRIRLYSSLQLFCELGGKTAGYLPGYSLSGGLVIRGGLTLCDY